MEKYELAYLRLLHSGLTEFLGYSGVIGDLAKGAMYRPAKDSTIAKCELALMLIGLTFKPGRDSAVYALVVNEPEEILENLIARPELTQSNGVPWGEGLRGLSLDEASVILKERLAISAQKRPGPKPG